MTFLFVAKEYINDVYMIVYWYFCRTTNKQASNRCLETNKIGILFVTVIVSLSLPRLCNITTTTTIIIDMGIDISIDIATIILMIATTTIENIIAFISL